MKDYLNKKLIVKLTSKSGRGLFAKEFIKKGELLGKMVGDKTKKDHIHVLWVSKNYGIKIKNKLKYSNHSWQSPNAELRSLKMYAIKDIKKGEEILWDYSCGYKYENKISKSNPLFDNIGMSIIHHSILDNNLNLFKKALNFLIKNKLDKILGYADENKELLGNLIHWIGGFGTKEMLVYYMKKKGNLFLLDKDNNNILNYIKLFDNKLLSKDIESLVGQSNYKKLLFNK